MDKNGSIIGLLIRDYFFVSNLIFVKYDWTTDTATLNEGFGLYLSTSLYHICIDSIPSVFHYGWVLRMGGPSNNYLDFRDTWPDLTENG